jgi:hypothetical protein
MSDAIIGYGTIVEVFSPESPGTPFELGEVNGLEPPDDSVDDVDVTHMQSPGRRREFIPGLIDGGEGSFDINWIPGNPTDDYVQDWKASGEVRTIRFTYPNNAYEEFPAYPKGMSKSVPLDDKLTATVTVKMAGDLVRGTAT